MWDSRCVYVYICVCEIYREKLRPHIFVKLYVCTFGGFSFYHGFIIGGAFKECVVGWGGTDESNEHRYLCI